MNQTPEEKNLKDIEKLRQTHIKPIFKKANNDKADCLTVTISIQTSRNKKTFYVIHIHIWGAYMNVLWL